MAFFPYLWEMETEERGRSHIQGPVVEPILDIPRQTLTFTVTELTLDFSTE